MIASVLFFSFGHAAVKWVPHLPFYQLVFLRAAITIIICMVALKIRGVDWRGKNKKLLLLRGFTGTIALTCYFYSLQNMPLASAVTIQYFSPILTLIFAHFFLKERSTKTQFIYFFLAFVGILFVKGFDSRITLSVFGVSLLSVVASAIAYNLVRLLRDKEDVLVVVLYFPLVTAVLVGPYSILNWVPPTWTDWFYILMIGVFTQIAQTLMTLSYQNSKASEVAIYNYLGIFISLAIGYYFFKETFTPLAVLGMLIITLSVVISSRSQQNVR